MTHHPMLSEDTVRRIGALSATGMSDMRVAWSLHCSEAAVSKIRRQIAASGLDAVLEARRRPVARTGGRPPLDRGICPPHVTAERCTDEWWDQNNAAFAQHMQWAMLTSPPEWPTDIQEPIRRPKTFVNMGGLR
jgi:hypothetical protein